MATMESVAADAAAAAPGMPRFEDGTVDMQELLRRLAERVIDETMASAASAAAEDAGTTGNGFGGRRLATCVGTLELRMPRLGAGSHFPSGIIERHSRTDEAMCAAVAEVHASGVSTRRVAGTARALGVDRPSEGQVGRICVSLDAGVEDLSGRESDGLGGLLLMFTKK